MISRIWHGWTKNENADKYETLLRGDVLPGIDRVKAIAARISCGGTMGTKWNS
jgi:hypothetical protein